MKKLLFNLITIILTALVLYLSITFFNEKNNEVSSDAIDVTRNISINDLNIKVKYINGNMIDESITYGNILEKQIEITNNNDEAVAYSITFKEVEINNNDLTVSLKASTNKEEYTSINEKVPVNTDMHIGYNLVIDANTKLYLTIQFKSNYEEEPTTIKGILAVEDNLSEKDLFLNNTVVIEKEIKDKITNLNGIVKSGYYLINLLELTTDISTKYKGYVLIDASDISQIKNVYYIYSDSFMLKGYTYDSSIDKSKIEKRDKEISALNDLTVCSAYTKNECIKFSSLKYNNLGSKKDFYNLSKEIVTKTKLKYPNEKNILIYDIKKDIDSTSKIRGYILINNVNVSEPEYYLYLTNDLFMISGYNLTKNGDYTEESTTIRAYNETAFNLSSASLNTVCTFSGFTSCVDANGILIK